MLLHSTFLENLILLFIYMFIYNISLILLFWILQQFINTNFNTLYSFSDLKFNTFFLTVITILLFSMAGVPPLLGFFTKLLILISLLHVNFVHLYIFFFIILFFSLYFYIQNIRFLYAMILPNLSVTSINFYRIPSMNYLLILFFAFFLILGGFFINDFFLYFTWLLI